MLGPLSLSLRQPQPLAQMGPKGPGGGRHLVFLSLVTALSGTQHTHPSQLMCLSLLPNEAAEGPLGQTPLQASVAAEGVSWPQGQVGKGGPSPSPACGGVEA